VIDSGYEMFLIMVISGASKEDTARELLKRKTFIDESLTFIRLQKLFTHFLLQFISY
jgi:hypothetical protein